MDDKIIKMANALYTELMEAYKGNTDDLPILDKIALLGVEFFTLDGLQDAKRKSDIENEIFEIIENEIKNN